MARPRGGRRTMNVAWTKGERDRVRTSACEEKCMPHLGETLSPQKDDYHVLKTVELKSRGSFRDSRDKV